MLPVNVPISKLCSPVNILLHTVTRGVALCTRQSHLHNIAIAQQKVACSRNLEFCVALCLCCGWTEAIENYLKYEIQEQSHYLWHWNNCFYFKPECKTGSDNSSFNSSTNKYQAQLYFDRDCQSCCLRDFISLNLSQDFMIYLR